MDWNLKRLANFFAFWCYVFQKSARNLLRLALSDKIHLISSPYLNRSILFLIKASKIWFIYAQNWPNTAKSSWHCSFNMRPLETTYDYLAMLYRDELKQVVHDFIQELSNQWVTWITIQSLSGRLREWSQGQPRLSIKLTRYDRRSRYPASSIAHCFLWMHSSDMFLKYFESIEGFLRVLQFWP